MDAYWPREQDPYATVPYGQLPVINLPQQEALYRRVKKLERKVDELAQLIEENNRLLRSLTAAGGQTVVPNGGGSTVVVRM